MKKIYLLLVLLFTGLQSVFAQFIWHPDLGTPYAGAISLPWDTRSYMFQVDNGEEFGSPGDIWDALDAQLRDLALICPRIGSSRCCRAKKFQSNCMVYQPERHTTYTNIIQRTI